MEESISDVKLYKPKINDSLERIYIKYIMLIKEYIEHFNKHYKNENIENDPFFNYLLLRGLQTISTLFNMLFLYLKNLDITYKHCQQGFFYYVEFIGQIGKDNGGFLQLSSKDAVLFVYKKTIFDINLEQKKQYTLTCKNEESLLYMIYHFTLSLNSLFEKLIVSNIKSNSDLNKYIDRIITLCNYVPNNNSDENKKKINIIYSFILKLSILSIDINKHIELVELFLKKITKVNKIKNNLIYNINNMDNETVESNKFINKLFLNK